MTHALLAPTAARRVFLTLTATRWLPVGLVVGVMMLLPLDRGLSVGQTVAAMAVSGLVVFALELPTSGFADAFGRKPVLVAAGLFNLGSALVFLVAHTFWAFVGAAVLTGFYRALDSGPLEAWFVDTVHQSDPEAEVDRTLAAQGVVTGLAMASGALVSGGLIWWHPFPTAPALLLPFQLWTALIVVHLVAVPLLMDEPHPRTDQTAVRRAADSVRLAPTVVRSGLRLLRSSAALRGIVLVTMFSAVAMVVFESLQPVRLAEILGSEEQAGALMGPAAAVGWAAFAAGSALVSVPARRWGVARAAMATHVLVAIGTVVMGLLTGAGGLVVAYLVTYALFGSTGPMHATLLHREAQAANRSTVLSIDSMAGFVAFGLGAPLLGLLADHSSLQVAMVTAGAVSALGVGGYRAAYRCELSHGVPAAHSA